MARPREFDEDQVKEAMMNVFWDKGYEATSMQDLVKATGLLKGSLYGAFGDKQAIYLIALKHYDRTRIQAGIDMLGGKGSGREKVMHLFELVIESAKTGVFAGGCLLCNASVEMATVDKAVGSSVKKTLQRLQSAICNAIAEEVDNPAKSESLAGFIICTYMGCRVLARAAAPIQTILDSRDHCLECLL
jgi:TetR/AcrR family transcriptional repressor of nem operon